MTTRALPEPSGNAPALTRASARAKDQDQDQGSNAAVAERSTGTSAATTPTEKSTNRDQLVRAIAAEDWATIDRLGWRPTFDRLKRWPKGLNGDAATGFAEVLGDYPADLVAEAVRQLAAEGNIYRPSPAEVARRVLTLLPPAPPKAASRTTPDLRRQAQHAAIRAALATGAQVCDCHPRPVNWQADPHGVLRCPTCAGHELGQAEDATARPAPRSVAA